MYRAVKREINIEKFLLKFLENYYEIDDNNCFKYEIYDESDKKLSNKNLEDIISAKNSKDKFYEIIVDFYEDYECIDCLSEMIKCEYPEIWEDYSEEISDWLWEHINI